MQIFFFARFVSFVKIARFVITIFTIITKYIRFGAGFSVGFLYGFFKVF